MKAVHSLLLVILAQAAACAPRGPGHFETTGFFDDAENYMVPYADQEEQSFVSEDWQVESWEPAEIGDGWRSKRGPAYETISTLRHDGEDIVHRGFRYDLRLEHRGDGSQIWIHTFPLEDLEADRTLSSMLADFVSNVSGSWSFTASYFDPRAEHPQSAPFKQVERSRSFTSTIVQQNPAKVDGYEAHASTIEVADVDRIRLAPDAREAKARILLVRVPRPVTVAWQYDLPARMLIVYLSRPETFEDHLLEFAAFIESIDIARSSHGEDDGLLEPYEEEDGDGYEVPEAGEDPGENREPTSYEVEGSFGDGESVTTTP